ncbi:MAG: class I SAM-dependent methyltransferase [Oscillospiraceae bacterium]|nr:class I SAM-dependent methyltransferase [Oscillospiraceae bacterium]
MEEKNMIRIEKGTVQETLIVPLYARKICTDKFPGLYSDPTASEICSRLDYDFSSLKKLYDESTIYEFGAMEAALRQLDMMWEINDYIEGHPDASIVCMGCGLDFDARRCGTERNRIFNIDFPDVIETREILGGIDPRETNIISDLNDYGWMEKINAENGTVFFAAGVFHYLKREDLRALIVRMAETFPGCRLAFDTVGKFGYKMMMREVLKRHGMNDFGTLFYSGNARKELSGWSDDIVVSSRGYMLGYYDMKNPGVRGIHRFLAKAGDSLMKMQIVRVEFAGE